MPFSRSLRVVVLAVAILPLSAISAVAGDRHVEGDSWVYFRQGTDAVTMSGHIHDLDRARAARSGDETLIWVRRGKYVWTVRDAGVLARIAAGWAPLEKLNQRMEKVSTAHEAVARRLHELAEKAGGIGARMGELGEQMGDGSCAEKRAELEAEMRKLEAEMRKVQVPMDAIQRALRPFQVEMERVSREIQRKSAAAEKRLNEILDAAISDGTALRLAH